MYVALRIVPRICLSLPLIAAAACGGGDASRQPGDAGDSVTRIAFYSNRDGNPEIYLMNADGSDPVRITHHSARDVDPDLSPDGRQIVFTSNREGNDDIFVVSTTGGEPVNLTRTAATEGWPRWSPDGLRIAFHSDRDGNPEIYIMNADGSSVTRLTNHPGPDLWPEWSPDGTRLSFRRDQDVYVMDTDGANITRVTESPTLDQMAAWSPDGRQLAFMSFRQGYCSIFVTELDGSGARNLTPMDEGDDEDDWCSRTPAWGRDGRIYFMSKRPSTGGDEELFVMNADGSGLLRLTNAPGTDGAPTVR